MTGPSEIEKASEGDGGERGKMIVKMIVIRDATTSKIYERTSFVSTQKKERVIIQF